MTVIDVCLRAVRRVLLELTLRMSPCRVLSGVPVYLTSARVDVEDSFSRVSRALELIERHDPHRLALAARRFRCIEIAQRPSDAYVSFARICELSDINLMRTNAAWTASVIVHEATHARLLSYGEWSDSTAQKRIEAICVKEQIRFLSRVPESESLIKHLESWLDSWPETDWNAEDAQKESVTEKLEALNAPRWVIRLARRNVERKRH